MWYVVFCSNASDTMSCGGGPLCHCRLVRCVPLLSPSNRHHTPPQRHRNNFKIILHQHRPSRARYVCVFVVSGRNGAKPAANLHQVCSQLSAKLLSSFVTVRRILHRNAHLLVALAHVSVISFLRKRIFITLILFCCKSSIFVNFHALAYRCTTIQSLTPPPFSCWLAFPSRWCYFPFFPLISCSVCTVVFVLTFWSAIATNPFSTNHARHWNSCVLTHHLSYANSFLPSSLILPTY